MACACEETREISIGENSCNDSPNEMHSVSRIASSADLSSIASFPEYDLNSSLSVNAIQTKLADIIKLKGSDLIKACRNFDLKSSNLISKAQFRQVLRTFCFPITAAQFESLCKEMGWNLSNKINYLKLFKQISGLENIEMHDPIAEKVSILIPVDEFELRLKNKINSNLREIVRAFWLFDVNKDGFVQKRELRRIIHNYCLDIDEHLFNELWKRYDPKDSGLINYKTFLMKLGINADRYKKFIPSETVARALCSVDPKAQKMDTQRRYEQQCRRAVIEDRDDPSVIGLPLEEIIEIFLLRAILVVDEDQSGFIENDKLKSILCTFCFPLSQEQFNDLISNLKISRGCVNYHAFLKAYKKEPNEDVTKWKGIVNKLVDFKSKCDPSLPSDEVEELLRDCLNNKATSMLQDFQTLDICNVGVVYKDDVRKLLSKYAFRLTDKQFRELWAKFPVNEFDLLIYEKFLDEYSKPRAKNILQISANDKEKCRSCGEKKKKDVSQIETEKKSISKGSCVEEEMLGKVEKDSYVKDEEKMLEKFDEESYTKEEEKKLHSRKAPDKKTIKVTYLNMRRKPF